MKHSDIKNNLLMEQVDPKTAAKEFGNFLLFCKKELKLDTLPKIYWETHNNVGHNQPSFGAFHNDNQTIHLSIINRHPLDIMRTLAHELCHYKQQLDGRLNSKSGETGSAIENEANAVAGVIMRKWGKANPNMFSKNPIIKKVSESKDTPTVIKLRGFTKSPDDKGYEQDKAKQWINKVYSKYPRNPMNNNQIVMVYDNDTADQSMAIIELVPSFTVKGAVDIKWFQAYPLRTGIGTKAMQDLQKLAATNDITLTLYPWDKGKVSQRNLIKFYKSVGFSPLRAGSDIMVWKPNKQVSENYKLSSRDSVEKWVEIFKKSTHPKFKNKTPAEREKMARAAYYRAVQNKK